MLKEVSKTFLVSDTNLTSREIAEEYFGDDQFYGDWNEFWNGDERLTIVPGDVVTVVYVCYWDA